MTLLGLTLAQLAAIFGAGGTVLTVLYILKLRRRRVHVPFAPLWARVIEERESSSLFRRLKRLLSLLLSLFLLLLLVGALGDPRLSERILAGRQIILLIDTSASMKTRDTDAGSRIAAAREAAREIIRGLGGADSLMVVRMDAQVTPLTAFTGDQKTLFHALDDLAAADSAADVGRALRFCADALRPRENPLLILIGDGAYRPAQLEAVRLRPPTSAPAKGAAAVDLDRIDLSGIPLRFVPVGRRSDNVGIVAFNARRYPANPLSFEVFLEVVNHRTSADANEVTEVDLQLLIDGVVSEVQRLRLRPGQRARYSCGSGDGSPQRQWCEMAASGELLEARLVPAGSTGKAGKHQLDAFALDDHAYALLPRRRKTRVLLVSRGSLFLEGALLLADNLKVQRIAPERYTPAAAAGVDAVVFDGVAPDDAPGKHLLLLDPPAAGGPAALPKVRRRLEDPAITDQRSDHPVMRWITLKDVNVAVASVFETAGDDVVLAASFRQPLVIAREQKRRRIIAIGFDPRRSDLPLRVAFPILLINAFHWFSGEGDDLLMTYRTGELWRVPLRDLGATPGGAEFLRVVAPDGERLRAPVQQGQLLLFGRLAGLYRVPTAAGDLRLAANLSDPAESEIAARELTVSGETIARPSGFGAGLRREIWIYLALLAAALLLLEWLTYNRRVTV